MRVVHWVRGEGIQQVLPSGSTRAAHMFKQSELKKRIETVNKYSWVDLS